MPHTAANPSRGPYNITGKSGPIKNKGGVLFYGGTIANTDNSSMGITYLGYRSGLYEAKPYLLATNMNYGVVAGLSNGTFASQTKGRYIMLTFTQYLAGVSNSLLNSPASVGQRGGQNPWSGIFRTPIVVMAGTYDPVTGMPRSRLLPGYPMPTTQDASVYPSSVPEQYPGTRSIPGRLFYIAAGIAKDGTPTASSYKAKTD